MSKKQKVTLVAVFAAVIVAIGTIAAVLNYQKTQEGLKHFQVEVVSERDDYSKTTECESKKEFLGEFMQEFKGCEWQDSEYGTYITGFDGMSEDMDNQYWWCVTVNGKESADGVDKIPLTEGDKYTFTLKQGW